MKTLISIFILALSLNAWSHCGSCNGESDDHKHDKDHAAEESKTDSTEGKTEKPNPDAEKKSN